MMSIDEVRAANDLLPLNMKLQSAEPWNFPVFTNNVSSVINSVSNTAGIVLDSPFSFQNPNRQAKLLGLEHCPLCGRFVAVQTIYPHNSVNMVWLVFEHHDRAWLPCYMSMGFADSVFQMHENYIIAAWHELRVQSKAIYEGRLPRVTQNFSQPDMSKLPFAVISGVFSTALIDAINSDSASLLLAGAEEDKLPVAALVSTEICVHHVKPDICNVCNPRWAKQARKALWKRRQDQV